jgi:subtilase family serine protease
LHIRRSALAIAGAFALFGSILPAAAAPSSRATLAGSVPPWATSANFKGAANTSDYVGFRVYLGWQNESQLQSFIQAVANPKSSSYGQYLTPAQFHQLYSPSQAQVVAVQSWLRNQGFQVEYTPGNNHYVSAEGTVAQAAAAFGTTFGTYSVDGMTLRSQTSPLTIPSSLAGTIDGVIGLDDTALLVHTNIAFDESPSAPPPAAFVVGTPCSSYFGQFTTNDLSTTLTSPAPGGGGTAYNLPLPMAPCGYTPQQVRGAYGVPAGGGAGETVAITDAFASPTIQDDITTYSSKHDLPNIRLSQITAPGTYNHPEAGARHDPQGWYGEETLDVDAVHGMAPEAAIVYVGAPNNEQDLDAALNHAIDRHVADIITNSWGFPTELLPPGFINPQEETFMQAQAEGISLLFSSGDNSDESLVEGVRTVDWPPASPLVTAVGGTSLMVGQNNNNLGETGWGTFNSTFHPATATSPAHWGTPSWLYGAGGGVSRLFAEPSYQVGVVLSNVFKVQGRTGRAVPDISAVADPNTGYLIGETQTFPDGTVKYSEYRIGGTSLSSPLMAGILGDANALRIAAHLPVLGFLNPRVYGLAVSDRSAFNDILDVPGAEVRVNFVNNVDASNGVTYRLRTFDQTLSLQTTSGYDDVTGIGTPTSAFIPALSQ